MKIRKYVLLVLLVLKTFFAYGVSIPADAKFSFVAYDHKYKKFIAIGNHGLVATSIDGEKWSGYYIMTISPLIGIEVNTEDDGQLPLISSQRELFTFNPENGQSLEIKKFGQESAIIMTQGYLDEGYYKLVSITANTQRVERCNREQCFVIYEWSNANNPIKNIWSSERDTLNIVLKNNSMLYSANTKEGLNFVAVKKLSDITDGDNLSGSGHYLFDWRNQGGNNHLVRIFSQARTAGLWTPLGNLHEPERMSNVTYASVFAGNYDHDAAGLSDDEDNLIFFGSAPNHQTELIGAEVVPSQNIYRQFIDTKFDVAYRTCGTSAIIDGKRVSVILGKDNYVLRSTEIKKVWKVFKM